jgi:hypothetical protein
MVTQRLRGAGTAQHNAASKTFRAFAHDASRPASLRSSPDIHVPSFAAVRLSLHRAESG